MSRNASTPPNNSATYHQTAGSFIQEEKCKNGQLRFGVFFDGTGNDPYNPVEYTNIKKLFDVYPTAKYDKSNYEAVDSAYIRGVGSRSLSDNNYKGKPFTPADYEGDGTAAGAFGAGGFARVNHMIYELELALDDYKKAMNCLPKVVFFDVFGFSRGAVQARHFVNVLKQGFYRLDGIYDYEPKDFHIASLNVFDSVASFNALSVLKPNDIGLGDSPQDYGWAFYIKPIWVDKIVHLMADDEYRQNFDGQCMDNSPDKSSGYPEDFHSPRLKELFCLGAHSDIGGGYMPVAHGRNSNDLAKIYLNQMYDLAKENGVPLITPRPKGSAWEVSNKLNDLYEEIQDAYGKYPDLKIAHKKFRERMAYLYDPDTNKHPPYMTYSETDAAIIRNQQAIQKRQSELKGLLYNLLFQPRSTILESEIRQLNKEKQGFFSMKKAFDDLSLIFTGINGAKDYDAFIETWIIFHNTYVHKSHSGVTTIGRSDYDSHGNKIEVDENKPELQKRVNDNTTKLNKIKTELAAHRDTLKELEKLNDAEIKQRYQGQITVPRPGMYQYTKLKEEEYLREIQKIKTLLPKEYNLVAKIREIQQQIDSTEYRKRDLGGMNAEVDGDKLHRNWYFKADIDVLKELDAQNNPSTFKKVLRYSSIAGWIIASLNDETNFERAIPKKLEKT